ncbi:MAG: hypothetical protein C3F06_02460 [Candidatus Methanoperedenaceae archaeon]|nr:MAG: hypothetical protein C3F06_02460 [Candidatus Methanoperedenaceae archaeon]
MMIKTTIINKCIIFKLDISGNPIFCSTHRHMARGPGPGNYSGFILSSRISQASSQRWIEFSFSSVNR